jgi:two-component system, OmpR family, alkaline phosphatase synthesis response regulator PhoP
MARILFLEDEADVLHTLMAYFKREGYEVIGTRSASEALSLAERRLPHLAVLDVMLHEGPDGNEGMDGFEVCKVLREQGFHGPVIFLTARNMEQDKLLGFEVGADDFVTKPFSLLELGARIKATLKRVGGGQSVYRFGSVTIDLDNYVIHRSDGEERLSNREQELLRYLIEHRGKVLPRDELLTSIWKYAPGVTTRTVDTHILNLRKKLGDDAQAPAFIETMHGVGYRFLGDEE